MSSKAFPNYDAASWNVGKATCRGSSQHGRARWQHVWPRVARKACDLEHIVQLVGRTSCRRLIVNHFVQTFRALGWFTAETDETKVQSSTNANDFARLFGRWHLHKLEVNKHLESLGCKPISVEDLAINSCQLMNVLQNFCFGHTKGWRAKAKIEQGPQVPTIGYNLF